MAEVPITEDSDNPMASETNLDLETKNLVSLLTEQVMEISTQAAREKESFEKAQMQRKIAVLEARLQEAQSLEKILRLEYENKLMSQSLLEMALFRVLARKAEGLALPSYEMEIIEGSLSQKYAELRGPVMELLYSEGPVVCRSGDDGSDDDGSGDDGSGDDGSGDDVKKVMYDPNRLPGKKKSCCRPAAK